MSITINRTERDALYDGLMNDLTAIGDIFGHLHNDEPLHAMLCAGASRSSYGCSMTLDGRRSQTRSASS